MNVVIMENLFYERRFDRVRRYTIEPYQHFELRISRTRSTISRGVLEIAWYRLLARRTRYCESRMSIPSVIAVLKQIGML